MPNIIDVVISYVGSIEHILRVTKFLEYSLFFNHQSKPQPPDIFGLLFNLPAILS